jgi:hypothetical protein
LLLDIPADSGFLWDKATVLGAAIKEKLFLNIKTNSIFLQTQPHEAILLVCSYLKPIKILYAKKRALLYF